MPVVLEYLTTPGLPGLEERCRLVNTLPRMLKQ